MEKWTQDEAIAFECAREVITDLQAILTSQIAEESGKVHPDEDLIVDLRAERARLFRERTELRLKDHANVARIRKEYGARVRAWRAEYAEKEAVAV